MTITEKLEKIGASINKKIKKGIRRPCQSVYHFIDGYNDLKEVCPREEWNKYCDQKGWDRKHDAYDFFA